MRRVAVIGAGIFGISCALELAADSHVTVFERAPDLLRGASLGNQNRFHYGYHYPRSAATGRECSAGYDSFMARFGGAVRRDFENYYAIAREGSKVSVAEYLRFCDGLGLPHAERWPAASMLDRSKIAACFRVPEPIMDLVELHRIAAGLLGSTPNLEVRLNCEVFEGRVLPSGAKRLELRSEGVRSAREFDVVVDCTYSRLNDFARWFGAPERPFQFELVEIPIVQIPRVGRVGVTVMDGPFCSVLPNGSTSESLLYHVQSCVLARSIGVAPHFPGTFRSNSARILSDCAEFFPAVSGATHLGSLFALRVVDPRTEADDARRSTLIPHGNGCWSIFSAKIVTACLIAQQLRAAVASGAPDDPATEPPLA